jgi:hypothetical protein
MKDALLFAGVGVVAWIVLIKLSNNAYDTVAATCNAQCKPPSVWAAAAGTASQPLCACAAYTQWQNQWGWFEPFVPQI